MPALREGAGAAEDARGRAYTPADIAVLYRTNAQSRVLEEQFGRYAIAYQVIGGTRFYERAEDRDALAYLSVICNPADEQRLLRIVNVPKRGLGSTSLARARVYADSSGQPLLDVLGAAEEIPDLTAAARKGFAEFAALIRSFTARQAGTPVEETLRALLEETGYLPSLRAQRTLEAEGRAENLEELIGVGAEYDPPRRGAFARGVPSGGLAVRRPGRLCGHRRADHAHDAAQCQGPGVPGGVHGGHGGGCVSPSALHR